eukprot:787730-Prorocentrum_minimum.AAC.1
MTTIGNPLLWLLSSLTGRPSMAQRVHHRLHLDDVSDELDCIGQEHFGRRHDAQGRHQRGVSGRQRGLRPRL